MFLKAYMKKINMQYILLLRGNFCCRTKVKPKVVKWLLLFFLIGFTNPLLARAVEQTNREDHLIAVQKKEPVDHNQLKGVDSDELLRNQKIEYEARVPKTVIELQQFRRSESITIRNKAGGEGTATLINLNPLINTWFILLIQWQDTSVPEVYHLENPSSGTQTIVLDPAYPEGIVMVSETGLSRYALWANTGESELLKAAKSGQSYAPLCAERVFLRNKTRGHKTTLETTTDFLRRHIWQGEKITTMVRGTFYKDAYLNTSELIRTKNSRAGARPRPPGAPARPLINPAYAEHFIIPHELGIDLESETGERILIGRWYRAKDLPGLFVSVIQPNLVSEQVIQSQGRRVNPLDEIESKALVYMIAFDLDRFDLGFEMGTEHPKVGWSDRVPEQSRDKDLPGPDGIDSLEPLVMTGLLNPAEKDRVTATFIGGFKRYHGAFKWSDLAFKNHGSHYGFIEHGAILSKLQPGLATILIYQNGTVDLKTWLEKDNKRLQEIRHARQNGVPIIDYDEAHGRSLVGALVPRWGQGNWSGSVDERFRTVRAGLGLQQAETHRFLIYAYFSDATPSAMARVFQAYCCKYAMLLDINALEHTYLAVYRHEGQELSVQHLVKGMSVLDKTEGDKVIPRFVGYADNRDFFYLLRKDSL
jgi:hypothetical protein